MSDIGKKLYNRRKELGLTLEEVGDAVGVGKSTVRRWENGMIKNMGRDKIVAVADALKMNPLELVPVQADTATRVAVVPEGKKPKRLFAMDAMPVKKAGATDYGIVRSDIVVIKADPKLKAMLGLWKTATPKAKDATIEVMKLLSEKEDLT